MTVAVAVSCFFGRGLFGWLLRGVSRVHVVPCARERLVLPAPTTNTPNSAAGAAVTVARQPAIADG